MTTPDVSGYGRERSHARLRNSDATLSMPDLVRGWSSPMARSLTKPSHEDHAEGAVTNVNREAEVRLETPWRDAGDFCLICGVPAADRRQASSKSSGSRAATIGARPRGEAGSGPLRVVDSLWILHAIPRITGA